MQQIAQPLLDFIAQPESRGDFDAIWGGIRLRDRPSKLLTQMTIGQVLAWQDGIDHKYRSEAAGRYQILEDTLRGLYVEAGLTPDSLFDRDGQNALGMALLRRRGFTKFMQGRISAETFCNSLAKEWASLPVVTGRKKGRSHYAGDGLNRSHVSVTAFLSTVRAMKSAKPKPLAPPRPGFWPALLRAIFKPRST